MSRSRRELSNEYLLEKIGFDTAENEPRQVCGTSRARESSLGSLTSLLFATTDQQLLQKKTYVAWCTDNFSDDSVCRDDDRDNYLHSCTIDDLRWMIRKSKDCK